MERSIGTENAWALWFNGISLGKGKETVVVTC
jgi:hypothetical protein